MKLYVVLHDPGAHAAQLPTQVIIARAAQSLGWDVRIGPEPDYDWPDVLLFNHLWDEPLPDCRPKKVLWSFDLVAMDPAKPLRLQDRWRGDVWRTMDLMLVRERGLLGDYRAAGVNAHWLDQACWPPEHVGRTFPYEHPCEVGFPGQGYGAGGRYELIDALAERFNVHVWCRNTHSWDGHNVTVHDGLYDGAIGQVVADADIIVGTNYRNDLDGCWSNRVWQVLGAGGCLLTREVPGLEDVLWAGEHCFMFDDADEAIHTAQWLLNHPGVRCRVARQGQRYAWMNHTYWHRLRELERLL